MSVDVLGYPEVGRFGLAHSLLAWARCEVWCAQHQVPMLAPSWLHLRIGPYLRGEMDKRAYHRLFQFPRYIGGLSRIFRLATWSQFDVGDPQRAHARGRHIVVFRNLVTKNFETFLPDILGHQDHLRRALEEMTKPAFRPTAAAKPFIAVHVRRGDFSEGLDLSALRAGRTNAQLPLTWYSEMITGVRKFLGPKPVRIFSDGRDEELALLLNLPQVQREASRSAVTDLLSLAQAKLIISSGSGFSIWGSFLGNVPRICFPGQRFIRPLGEPNGIDLEPEYESASDFSPGFMACVGSLIHDDIPA